MTKHEIYHINRAQILAMSAVGTPEQKVDSARHAANTLRMITIDLDTAPSNEAQELKLLSAALASKYKQEYKDFTELSKTCEETIKSAETYRADPSAENSMAFADNFAKLGELKEKLSDKNHKCTAQLESILRHGGSINVEGKIIKDELTLLQAAMKKINVTQKNVTAKLSEKLEQVKEPEQAKEPVTTTTPRMSRG